MSEEVTALMCAEAWTGLTSYFFDLMTASIDFDSLLPAPCYFMPLDFFLTFFHLLHFFWCAHFLLHSFFLYHSHTHIPPNWPPAFVPAPLYYPQPPCQEIVDALRVSTLLERKVQSSADILIADLHVVLHFPVPVRANPQPFISEHSMCLYKLNIPLVCLPSRFVPSLLLI